MKRLNSKPKNILYLFYRLVNPIVDPIKFIYGLVNYPLYLIDLYKYFSKDNSRKIHLMDLYPMLHDKTDFTPFDHHYYYQQLWVFSEVLKNKPQKHIDIASTYEMSGYISEIVPTEFVDIRPIKVTKRNLTCVKGSVTNLPYEDNSLESMSCLHVLEHIGLGRYGDPIDPQGINKAARELTRVLKPGGSLYFSSPIGKTRVCFNAHRVSDPQRLRNMFTELELVSFSAVSDDGALYEDTNIDNFSTSDYALGMYKFSKKTK